jgi:hypothetical protein
MPTMTPSKTFSFFHLVTGTSVTYCNQLVLVGGKDMNNLLICKEPETSVYFLMIQPGMERQVRPSTTRVGNTNTDHDDGHSR